MKKRVTILSIDGGGMRGVIPAMIIAEIERLTGKHSYELFDLIAGSSTGGIMAACLVTPLEDGTPKFTGKSLVKVYEDEGPKVFSHSLWHQILSGGSVVDAKYPSDGAEEVFNRQYGQVSLKDALTEVLIPAFELELGVPLFFKSHDAKRDPAKNFLLQQAVLATISAPTFFKPYVIESQDLSLLKHLVFVDGGVIANNPAMCAYVEAKLMFPDAEEYLVVSLGTGDYGASHMYETTNGWGAAQWARPLLRILLTGSVDIVDHQLKVLMNTKGDNLNHYYRFQLPMQADTSPLDDASATNLHSLELIAENMIREKGEELEALCKILAK